MPVITRSDAEALLARQDGREIWQAAAEQSAALRFFRRVDMGKKLARYPVAAALPVADFVSGEDPGDPDAIKPTTNMRWTHRDLVAEEIAGIAVIPENVLDDAGPEFDLWGEIKPYIAEAVGARLDRAVFFGLPGHAKHPVTWPRGLARAAFEAGNSVVEGTSVPEGAGAANDLAEDINATIGLVEADGFDPTALFARRTIRQRVRGLRDANNAPIYQQTLAEAGRLVPSIYGVNMGYVANGAWVPSLATLIAGDPRFAILGLRQDLTFKFLDQAAVTIDGQLVSLAENDLLGLRFKMRVGFQTAQVITKDGGETAFPFAVLRPVGS